jgi:hypothetical protein
MLSNHSARLARCSSSRYVNVTGSAISVGIDVHDRFDEVGEMEGEHAGSYF